MIYPLKFRPIYKQRIWGGDKLASVLGKNLPPTVEPFGESWELSGVQGDVSVVSNGVLKGNSLNELIEIYMGDLVGDKNFERFGEEFPLLVKLIDANDYLSIQVHPNDDLAKERHQAYGKTEMWYVIDCQKDAKLLLGFNQPVDKEKYLHYLNQGRIEELLTCYTVAPGDLFFIPAGAVHAIGRGVLIAEIQQTSDITYRLYDFNRVDASGISRELHTELALDAIDYRVKGDYLIKKETVVNSQVNLQSCPYFSSSMICVDGQMGIDYTTRDSFTIILAIDGSCQIGCDQCEDTLISKGETVLIPASMDSITLTGKANLLTSWID